MICRAGLRGRAPFSCGKKRALPLKLPLPPKTAHGKARSTRLPSFRTKKRKAGKRQQKCRPKGVRHTGLASSLPAGTACRIMLCIPETASQASYTAIGPARCSGTTIFKERKRTWEEGFGLREKNSACPAGLCFLFPSRQRQALIKFFGVEGEREGEASPFVHQRGASPSHLSFPPTAGDPARAGRWPRPHGRERWRPCPPGRRWYGPDAAPGCRRGRRGPGRARPAP